MQIFVVGLSSLTHSLQLPSDASVSSVKELLESREGVPSALQRLAFAGRELGGRTLADCGVGADATLHLSVPLDGGAKKRKKKIFTTPKVIPHKHKTIKVGKGLPIQPFLSKLLTHFFLLQHNSTASGAQVLQG